MSELDCTGERYLPYLSGDIELEHMHRYLITKELVCGKDVLDIASGEGYGSAMLADLARSVVGVDISSEAVEHAQIKYVKSNLQFKVGSCSEIPLLDNSIDVVVSYETIEHHDKHEEMMAEIKRVLRPDGLLIISSPDKHQYSDLPNYQNPYHVKELYTHEFSKLLESTFKNVVLFGQRIFFGSGLFAEKIKSDLRIYSLDSHSYTTGLSNPLYSVAIASDSALPNLSNSILEQEIANSDLIKTSQERLYEQDCQIINLNQNVLRLNNLLAEKERQNRAFLDSKSWRWTKPFRSLSTKIEKIAKTARLLGQ